MSNRTLIEINHDYARMIVQSPGLFYSAVSDYLRSASPDHAQRLERYGVRVLAMRHHSEKFPERVDALILANMMLDRPYADPDDDLATLARQLIRRTDELEVIKAALYESLRLQSHYADNVIIVGASAPTI